MFELDFFSNTYGWSDECYGNLHDCLQCLANAIETHVNNGKYLEGIKSWKITDSRNNSVISGTFEE